MRGDLLAGEVTGCRQTVPLWLPDETLFSLCSRTHVLMGNALDRTTCLSLFGHPRQGCQHDLPVRVDYFARTHGQQLGSSLDIITRHTVLGFYLPFRSPACANGAVATMAGETAGTLKFRLGLLTSRFRAHHPLKSCPACRAEDRARHHVPYWHLTHQLPGVWICPRHGEWLEESRLKSSGVGQFRWLLPADTSWRFSLSAPDKPLAHHLARLALGATALRELPAGFMLDTTALRDTYREGLQQAGLLKGDRILHGKAAPALVSAWQPLRQVEELRGLPRTASQASAVLSRLLATNRHLTHPLWHLATGLVLFDSWAAFLAAYSTHLHGPAPAARSTLPQGVPADLSHKREVIRLIGEEGYSCRAAARTAGVETGTAMAWAASAGLQIARRPKQISASMRTAMIRQLRRGADKTTVADHFSVSIESITRLLRTEVGLQVAWRQARFSRAQRQARSGWAIATRRHPTLGTKAIRGLVPATYAWLYRNDRAWLQAQIALLPSPIAKPPIRLDWPARDAELSEAVHLAQSQRPPPRSLTQICQAVPMLKARLGQLDRLPLTRAAIDAMLQASRCSSSATTGQ